MLKADIYQQHLNEVSRSFAFCIAQLPSPLKDWVGLSYLLCRLLDTIEDAGWGSETEQIEAFRKFDQALSDPARIGEFHNIQFPADVTQGELALMENSEMFFNDYHELPKTVREAAQVAIQAMSSGMQLFSLTRKGGVLKLANLDQVNQYCFVVAGVVGELLAKLVAVVEPQFTLDKRKINLAHQFGLFLQKVNLLKDQVSDEQVGRELVPDRLEVEQTALDHASSAFQFLNEIPARQIEFKRFCAWSLFMGLEALKISRQSLASRLVVKVDRSRTMELLAEIEPLLESREALGLFFQNSLKAVRAPEPGWATA